MAGTLTEPTCFLGVYGPGQCEACTKHFSRGLAIVDVNGKPLASLCMWCCLAMIDKLTDWDVTSWIISLYQKKRFARSWKQENYLRRIREMQAERALTSSADPTRESTPKSAPTAPRKPFRWSGAK